MSRLGLYQRDKSDGWQEPAGGPAGESVCARVHKCTSVLVLAEGLSGALAGSRGEGSFSSSAQIPARQPCVSPQPHL